MDVRTSFLSLAATIGIAGGGCVVALGPAYRQGLREAEPHRPANSAR
jgi:hypothetical protein